MFSRDESLSAQAQHDGISAPPEAFAGVPVSIKDKQQQLPFRVCGCLLEQVCL